MRDEGEVCRRKVIKPSRPFKTNKVSLLFIVLVMLLFMFTILFTFNYLPRSSTTQPWP